MSTTTVTGGSPGAPRLSVVIPTYERPERVVRLVEHLAEQTVSPDAFEVIVVDDGSREDPGPRILAAKTPYRLVFERQANKGPSAARHRGAEIARGEIVLFLDDDMIPSPGLLAAHIEAHRASPRALVVGALQSGEKVTKLSLFERLHARRLEELTASVRETGRSPRATEMYSGNMSVRRADYFAVGGFDRSLRRAEDTEIAMRLEDAGVKLVLAVDALAIHDSDHGTMEAGLRSAFAYGEVEQRISRKYPDTPRASPWRYVDILSLLPQPALALGILAPAAGRVAARGMARVATGLDALGLEREALAATMVAYGMEYFRGVRSETGSLGQCARDLRRYRAIRSRSDLPSARGRHRPPRKGHTRRSERRAAVARFVASVRADHAAMQRYDAKYDTRGREPAPLARSLVERVGLQMMAACRLMRLAGESGSPLGAKVVARMIRLLYGADIHWNARIADGVSISHGMGIAINHAARIGERVILSHNVTIGDGIDPETRLAGAPTIEDDVHIGPGATILGPITVGARSKIGPGAVVRRSIPPDSVVEAPAPTIRPRAKRPEGARAAAAS